MRTCGLSHQINGPVIVNLTILPLKPVLAIFTVVGPLIWCDNLHVRMSKILYIHNNDFHNLGKSKMCAGACYLFRTSKPHSGTLCGAARHGPARRHSGHWSMTPRQHYLRHYAAPCVDHPDHCYTHITVAAAQLCTHQQRPAVPCQQQPPLALSTTYFSASHKLFQNNCKQNNC